MWNLVAEVWNEAGKFIYEALMIAAAQSRDIYADDTGARILEVIAENQELPEGIKGRACHTTVICAKTQDNHPITLYMTADKYSGENLDVVLANRENPEHQVRLMSDASSMNSTTSSKLKKQNKKKNEKNKQKQNTNKSKEEKENTIINTDPSSLEIAEVVETVVVTLEPELQSNIPTTLQIIIFYCLSHGRRKFVDLLGSFKEECTYFILEIAEINKNDTYCKTRFYRESARLKYHKMHSAKHISNIYKEIYRLFDKKLVEPNSALGKAMNYWITHKEELTRFLRVKGVRLDNNCSEERLRFIINQRKNSLFYKSRASAAVWSGFASIVKTSEDNKINVFAYLNWIQENSKEIQKDPESYLPWKFAEYLSNTEKKEEVAVAA
jgi:hypothetical protein